MRHRSDATVRRYGIKNAGSGALADTYFLTMKGACAFRCFA